MPRRAAALIAAIAAACGIFLAGPGPSASAQIMTPARVAPLECVSTAKVVPLPGGNGSKYKSEKGGVYGFTITLAKPLIRHTVTGRKVEIRGYIYAGSTNGLHRRRAEWRRWWKMERLKRANRHWRDSKFVWHVLVRDWSVAVNGPRPRGLSASQVRLGAEQVAISKFKSWGSDHGYASLNKINAISRARRAYRRMVSAGQLLMEKQLENNAVAGKGELDGDSLNIHIESGGGSEDYSDVLPAGAMSELPGGSGC